MKWSEALYGEFIGGRGAVGLLVLRIVAGLGFVFHGWGKIQNPFGWMGSDAGIPGFFQALAAIAAFVGFEGSYEPALIYLCIALLFLLLGPGRYSIDANIFGRSAASSRGNSKV